MFVWVAELFTSTVERRRDLDRLGHAANLHGELGKHGLAQSDDDVDCDLGSETVRSAFNDTVRE